MTRPVSVVIVGAGAVGLSVAWYALRDGHRVTLVERGAADHDCCSLGNAGLIVPSHFIPLAAPGMVRIGLGALFAPLGPVYVRPRIDLRLLNWVWLFARAANSRRVAAAAPVLRDFARLSRRCFEEFAAQRGNDFGLAGEGVLMLCRTPAGLREEAHTAAFGRQIGVDAREMSAAEVARLEPSIRMEIAGGVYYPGDAHLIPQSFVAALTEELKQGGAQFEWSTEATGWRQEGSRLVALQTAKGEIAGDEFVLAAGSWSPLLARTVGLRLPIEAGKGYSVTLPQPRALPRISAVLSEARVAVTPMGSSLRFAGTMEIAGLANSTNEARGRAMIDSIAGYFPDFVADDFRGIPVWHGLRPCSADGLPFVGRVRRFQNLLIASGHSMMGLCLSPATGLLICELIAGRKPSLPLELLAPDRYA